MKDREELIAFTTNYCQHYTRKGSDMVCAKGMDLRTLKRVATNLNSLRCGPCIGGHTLENPYALCPHWLRATREQGEIRADQIEAMDRRMTLVNPVVSAWRKKQPLGKAEVIECPACKGRLHLSQSAYNGHVRAQCSTPNCVNWIE